MKRLTAVILIFIFVFSLSSCSKGDDGRFAYPLSGSPQTLDPQYITGRDADIIINNCFEGLTRIDSNGNVVPGVAKSWAVSENGLEYAFTLRSNTEWCVMKRVNGLSTIGEDYEDFDNRVTAYDFAFAFTRAVKGETECPAFDEFRVLKNAEAVNAGTMPISSLGVSAKDDFTLVLTLEHPCPDLLSRLAGTAFMPCNEEFFKLCGGRYGLDSKYLLCNGPFYLSGWDSSEQIILRRNSGYKGESSVKPASVTFYFNNNAEDIAGKLSLGTYSGAMFAGDDSVSLSNCKTVKIENSVYGICFNCADEVIKNEYIRLALCFCLKRSDFELPEGSRYSRTCVPPTCKAGDVNYFEQVNGQMPTVGYDPETARTYWNAGLEVLSKKSLALNLICEERFAPSIRTQIQKLQQAFSVDLSVSIETVTAAELEKRVNSGNYQLAFAPVHSTQLSAADFLANYIAGKTDNVFNLNDEEYGVMITKALDVDSQQNVLNGCFSADSYLVKHAIFYPVFTGFSTFATANTVNNIEASVSGGNISFINATTTE